MVPYLNIFSDIFFFAIALLCAYYGVEIVETIRAAGQASSSMPWLFKWYVYLVVPIGFVLTLFRLVQDVASNVLAIARSGRAAREMEEKL